MFILMVIAFLNSFFGGEWEGGRDQRQNVQLRNFELEGKMKIKKKVGPPAPLPGEEEWCAPPSLEGVAGKGEGHPESYYHRVRRYHLSKGREDPRTCHGRGGSNPTHPKPHHKGERGGGRDRPSPSPLPSSPRGGCGPWALDHSWAKRTAGWALLDPGLVMV